MKFDVLNIAAYAAKAVSAIVSLIPIVEQLKQAGKITSNADARDTVVNGAMNALAVAEGISGRDLANDAELRALAGDVVDAVYRFHKVAAQRVTTAPTI
jgi:hypothetical protein